MCHALREPGDGEEASAGGRDRGRPRRRGATTGVQARRPIRRGASGDAGDGGPGGPQGEGKAGTEAERRQV